MQSELIARDGDLRAQIEADNRRLEFKAEHAKLPQPNMLSMYRKEDIERLIAKMSETECDELTRSRMRAIMRAGLDRKPRITMVF